MRWLAEPDWPGLAGQPPRCPGAVKKKRPPQKPDEITIFFTAFYFLYSPLGRGAVKKNKDREGGFTAPGHPGEVAGQAWPVRPRQKLEQA